MLVLWPAGDMSVKDFQKTVSTPAFSVKLVVVPLTRPGQVLHVWTVAGLKGFSSIRVRKLVTSCYMVTFMQDANHEDVEFARAWYNALGEGSKVKVTGFRKNKPPSEFQVL